MALLVMAPLVSRVLSATPAAMAHATTTTGADCTHGMAGAGHPAKQNGAQDPTDCCGYCVLLGQQSLLAAYILPYLLPVAPREAVAATYRVPPLEPLARLWARPRGPPCAA